MRKADYIISYDIANSKRLQKLARQLEKVSMRIQYSVYFAPLVNQEELFDIIESINSIIDEHEDDVRIYTIVSSGYALGQAINLDHPIIFI